MPTNILCTNFDVVNNMCLYICFINVHSYIYALLMFTHSPKVIKIDGNMSGLWQNVYNKYVRFMAKCV
jgi:hypothetical protein